MKQSIIYDSEARFTIDPITRAVKSESEANIRLIQFDHNSERFIFDLPKMIDGHDMLSCNVVQIHYLIIEQLGTRKKVGVYDVDDLHISPDNDESVTFSWLISRNVTQSAGTLHFMIRFLNISDGVEEYVWNTATYSSVSIESGIFNGDSIVEEYPDILAQWDARMHELERECKDSINQNAQQIAVAIDRLAIHATAAGNPAVIRDGADWQMEGLRVYGQSIQVTTTGAQMFDASKRIVGGIINNGIQASNSRYACSDFIEIPQGTSNLYQSGGALNQRGFYDADKAFISKPAAVNNATVPDNAKYIRISSDIDKQDMANIMLCVGSVPKPYEPYTGGKPSPNTEYPQAIIESEVKEIRVTGGDKSQAITLCNPITLRGVPVKYGGTVTIDGQQYISDVIIEKNGVIGVKRRVMTTQLSVAEMNASERLPGWQKTGLTEQMLQPTQNILCTHLLKDNISINFASDIIFLERTMTQSEWKATYPDLVMDFVFPLREPTFEPLPDTEQQEIRALRTYHGNTVVTAGAWTETDYVADPKLYIDKKASKLLAEYAQSLPVTIPEL